MHPPAPRRLDRAFTMIELIVVVVILGILAAIAAVSYNQVITNSQDASARTTAQTVASEAQALAAFRGDGTLTSDDFAQAAADLPAPASGTSAAGGWKLGTANGGFVTKPGALDVRVAANARSAAVTTVSASGHCVFAQVPVTGTPTIWVVGSVGANCSGDVAQTATKGGAAITWADPAKAAGTDVSTGITGSGGTSTAPATPTLTATIVNGAISVNWSSVTGAVSYKVEQSTDGGSTWSTIYSGGASAMLVSWTTGTPYSFRVSAVGASATSPVSPVTAVLPAPTVTATASGPGLAVSWGAVANAAGYKVETSTDGVIWTTSAANVAGVSYTVPSVLASTAYKVRVSALGSGSYGTSGATVASVTSGPAAVAAVVNGNGSSTLTWSRLANATTYGVVVNPTVANTGSNFPGWNTTTTDPTTTATVPAVPGSGALQASVTAKNSAGTVIQTFSVTWSAP